MFWLLKEEKIEAMCKSRNLQRESHQDDSQLHRQAIWCLDCQLYFLPGSHPVQPWWHSRWSLDALCHALLWCVFSESELLVAQTAWSESLATFQQDLPTHCNLGTMLPCINHSGCPAQCTFVPQILVQDSTCCSSSRHSLTSQEL